MSIYDHNMIHLDNLKYINEAYVGKTPILEQVEQKIHEYRKKNITINNCSSTSKEILDINRLMEKQFGIDTFALKIVPTEEIDAYNYPLACRFDVAEKNLKDFIVGNPKFGYKFKKGNNLCIIVAMSYGLFMDKRFSDGQIVACMLHEVGHNFGDCLDNDLILHNRAIMIEYKQSIITDIVMRAILGILAIPFLPYELLKIKGDIDLYNQNTNSKLQKKEKRNNKKKPGSGKIAAFFGGIKGSISDAINLKYIVACRTNANYINSILQYKKNITDEDKKIIKAAPDRKGEVIADKFTSIYGYGIEFSELLMNFDNISGSREYKAARRMKPKYKDLNDEFEKAMFDINDTDCHPNSVQRLNTLVKTLKVEVEKEDIDPKVKTEILDQINSINKNLDDLTDASNKIYSIDKARAIYLNYVKDNEPDAIDSEIEDRVDKMLDDYMNKKKK